MMEGKEKIGVLESAMSIITELAQKGNLPVQAHIYQGLLAACNEILLLLKSTTFFQIIIGCQFLQSLCWTVHPEIVSFRSHSLFVRYLVTHLAKEVGLKLSSEIYEK